MISHVFDAQKKILSMTKNYILTKQWRKKDYLNAKNKPCRSERGDFSMFNKFLLWQELLPESGQHKYFFRTISHVPLESNLLFGINLIILHELLVWRIILRLQEASDCHLWIFWLKNSKSFFVPPIKFPKISALCRF